MNDYPTFQALSPSSLVLRKAARQLSLAGRLLVLASLAAVSGAEAAVPKPVAANRAQIDQSYGQMPLSFEANRGQTDAQVQFLARGSGYSLFLTPKEAVLALRKTQDKPNASGFKPGDVKRMTPPKPASTAVLRMQLIDGNAKAKVSGLESLPGQVNYLHGKNSKNWHTGIANYAKVKYAGVYPGVDLVYYGKQRQLEYDFVVAPGADPKAIRMHFEGAERLVLDDEGKLIVKTAGGDVIQHKPVVYQEINGVRKNIAGNYMLYPAAEGKAPQVGFQLAQYDPSRPLTIDPVMAYAIYLGGSGDDQGADIAVDHFGNVYVTGSTQSTDFPVARPFQDILNSDDNGYGADAFVTKFNANGNLIYSTYLGGSGYESGSGIAVDRLGNAYVTGSTTSTDFPTKKPLQATLTGTQIAFVLKLNPAGSLVYSTYLGGSGIDLSNAIAVDRLGNAYVAGNTDSTDFPTAHALQANLVGASDVFVAKLNSSGSALVYATYLGGSGNVDYGDVEVGNSIAVDRWGSAYVTGSTLSADFPTVRPLQPAFGGTAGGSFPSGSGDAFVAKFNPSGSLDYATYLGGEADEGGTGIDVDGQGSAYVTGGTWSPDFPTAQPWQEALAGGNDAFVAKLNPAGSALVYSTYLGGSSYDYGYFSDAGKSIAVDRWGRAYVSGVSSSGDFHSIRPLQGGYTTSFRDPFVTKFRANGSVVYSTYLGGGTDSGYGGIAVDSLGNAYVTGMSDSSYFPYFPTSRLLHVGPGGYYDAFVAKIAGN